MSGRRRAGRAGGRRGRQAQGPTSTRRALARFTWPAWFGLLLLQDLARTAGGRLGIDASPGRGTTLQLEVPPR